MDSDMPSSQDLGPQDPARFSKPRSEPPILDLTAEKPADDKTEDEQPKARTAKTESVTKSVRRHLPIGGFIAGMIGGGVIALGVLGYAQVTNRTYAKLQTVESELAAKAERGDLDILQSHIAGIDSTLTDLKSALADARSAIRPLDPELAKRISALEEAIRVLESSPSSPATSHEIVRDDRNGLRLALILSLRDAIRAHGKASRELTTLEQIGMSGPAWTSVKLNLATPLPPYETIKADVMALKKSGSTEINVSSDVQSQATVSPSFLSYFVTVRPIEEKASDAAPPHFNYAPLLDAIEQNNSSAALVILKTIPASEQSKFASIARDLQRHADIDANIAQLIDGILVEIQKQAAQ